MADAEGNEPPAPVAEITQALFDQVMAIVDQNDAVIEERSILALTSLDFLGLGVPPTTPSLGELLSQGKENIEAWWLSLGAFVVLVGTLMLLIFIGEALREALDTRKS